MLDRGEALLNFSLGVFLPPCHGPRLEVASTGLPGPESVEQRGLLRLGAGHPVPVQVEHERGIGVPRLVQTQLIGEVSFQPNTIRPAVGSGGHWHPVILREGVVLWVCRARLRALRQCLIRRRIICLVGSAIDGRRCRCAGP